MKWNEIKIKIKRGCSFSNNDDLRWFHHGHVKSKNNKQSTTKRPQLLWVIWFKIPRKWKISSLPWSSCGVPCLCVSLPERWRPNWWWLSPSLWELEGLNIFTVLRIMLISSPVCRDWARPLINPGSFLAHEFWSSKLGSDLVGEPPLLACCLGQAMDQIFFFLHFEAF